MTFRRLLGAFSVTACIASSLLRMLIVLEGTDTATGFPRTGPLWSHYLLLAAPVLLVLLFSLAIPTDTCHSFRPGAGIPAFCGLLFSGALGIGLYALGHTGLPVLAVAVLMAAGSLWFAGQMLRGSSAGPFFGVLGALGWLLVCIMLFSGKAASLYHISHVLELLCSAGILLFLCGVLRAAYSAGAPGISRMLFFRGMLAFYLGVCLLLPQELLLWKQGQPVLFFQGKCIGAALLGLSGLIWALRCMCSPGEPVREIPDTEADPAAAFAKAEQLLMEDASSGTDAPAAPQQRWSAAASALYGSTGPKAADPAETVKPAMPDAPPAAPKVEPTEPNIEAAVPSVETPVSSAAAAPMTEPVPAPEDPAVSAAKPAVPAPKRESPAAAPRTGSTMERLDSLLDTIGTAPRSDSIDTLLEDLNRIAAEKSEAAPDAPAEKWVFHRD